MGMAASPAPVKETQYKTGSSVVEKSKCVLSGDQAAAATLPLPPPTVHLSQLQVSVLHTLKVLPGVAVKSLPRSLVHLTKLTPPPPTRLSASQLSLLGLQIIRFVSAGEQLARSLPQGDHARSVTGVCPALCNLVTQLVDGLDTMLVGSTVHTITPAMQPTASCEAEHGLQVRQLTPFIPACLSSGWVLL